MRVREPWARAAHLRMLSGMPPKNASGMVLLTLLVMEGTLRLTVPPGHCTGCGERLHGWPETKQWVTLGEEKRHVCLPCKGQTQLLFPGTEGFRLEEDLEVLARCWDIDQFDQRPRSSLLQRVKQFIRRVTRRTGVPGRTRR